MGSGKTVTTYKVFFEIYGKKMAATVQAKNKYEAMQAVKSKILFHEVRESDSISDTEAIRKLNTFFDSIFGDAK